GRLDSISQVYAERRIPVSHTFLATSPGLASSTLSCVEKHRRVRNAPAIAPLDCSLFHFFPFPLMQTSVKTADCLECSTEKRDAIVDGSYANHDGGDRKLPRRPANRLDYFPMWGKYDI
ncbi:hypothetical protein ALC56_01217, partial [Trachymyrmex septentrionalis]